VLRWRLLSSFVILSLLLSLVALDYQQIGLAGIWLAPVFLIVTVLATEEVISLLRNQRHDPIPWATYLGSVALALAGCYWLIVQLLGKVMNVPDWSGTNWSLLALALGVILALGGEMWRFKRAGEGSIVNAALAIFAMVYVGGLMSFLAKLRLDVEPGLFAFLSVPVIVKLADTGAYATGRIFGRHKMTPLLSPGKTWEGAIGGVFFGCLGSWLAFRYLLPSMRTTTPLFEPHWIGVIAYGLALTLAGMHGDLAESLLKRDMQRKDSSTWLPGLGGVLDIIDSVLIAAPVAYLFWEMGWLG
jgi:phosphatidate cytidylyltransferase